MMARLAVSLQCLTHLYRWNKQSGRIQRLHLVKGSNFRRILQSLRLENNALLSSPLAVEYSSGAVDSAKGRLHDAVTEVVYSGNAQNFRLRIDKESQNELYLTFVCTQICHFRRKF
jgi:hypothetical protein